MEPAKAQKKARLRREVLLNRDAMPEVRRIEASLEIAERAAAELALREIAVAGGYLPIRSEVDPRPLMALLSDRRIRLCVPAIVGDHLEFRELLRGATLEAQGLGTVAPACGAALLRPDVLLVPLAAFDARGQRIGYGRGFYDRAIAQLRGDGRPLTTIGLAFAAQEVDCVPNEPFDVALDAIVTEAATIRPKPGLAGSS